MAVAAPVFHGATTYSPTSLCRSTAEFAFLTKLCLRIYIFTLMRDKILSTHISQNFIYCIYIYPNARIGHKIYRELVHRFGG